MKPPIANAEALAFTGRDFDVMIAWQDEDFATSRNVGLAIDWQSEVAPEVLNVSVPAFDTAMGWTRHGLCDVVRTRDAIIVLDETGLERGRFDDVRAALEHIAATLNSFSDQRPKLPPRLIHRPQGTKAP